LSCFIFLVDLSLLVSLTKTNHQNDKIEHSQKRTTKTIKSNTLLEAGHITPSSVSSLFPIIRIPKPANSNIMRDSIMNSIPITVSTDSPQGPKRRSHRARFNDNDEYDEEVTVQVYPTLSRREMSQSERDDAWLNEMDKFHMRNDVAKAVKRRDESVRIYLPSNTAEYRRRITEARKVVVLAAGAGLHGTSIAELYHATTARSRREAYCSGLKLEAELRLWRLHHEQYDDLDDYITSGAGALQSSSSSLSSTSSASSTGTTHPDDESDMRMAPSDARSARIPTASSARRRRNKRPSSE
jgi:hypothetical protein